MGSDWPGILCAFVKPSGRWRAIDAERNGLAEGAASPSFAGLSVWLVQYQRHTRKPRRLMKQRRRRRIHRRRRRTQGGGRRQRRRCISAGAAASAASCRSTDLTAARCGPSVDMADAAPAKPTLVVAVTVRPPTRPIRKTLRSIALPPWLTGDPAGQHGARRSVPSAVADLSNGPPLTLHRAGPTTRR